MTATVPRTVGVTEGNAPADELRSGWRIIITALLGLACGLASIPFYTMGIFAPILAQEFGWHSSQIMLGFSLLSICTLLGGPIFGSYIDKHGSRAITLVSIALFGLSVASFSLGTGSLIAYYASWIAMSVTGIGTMAITWTRLLGGWFEQRRGLALGIALTGSGLFGICGKPYTAWLIETYGWRAAFVGLAALPLLIALPLAWCWLRERDRVSAPIASAAEEVGAFSFSQIVSRWTFWMIAVVFIVLGSTTSALSVHLENLLLHVDIAPAEIKRITPTMGLSVLIGRVLSGWLLDKVWAPGLTCAAALLAIAGCAIWLSKPTAAYALMGICATGVSGGAIYALLSFLTVQQFGLQAYGSAFGLLMGLVVASGGIGPLLMGYALDASDSYDFALTCSVAALLLVAGLALTLGTRQLRFTHAAETPD
ncbi:MAG: MFS transporter [Steroidobacteraceae bacterium]